MAKQSGMGDNFYIAGVDVSGDVGSIGTIGGGPVAMEMTGIDKSGHERVGGKIDGRVSWSSWFNPTRAHLALRGLPRTDVIMSYCRGTALGSPGAALVAKQPNYDGNRGADGSLTFAVDALANGFGIEWGTQLTAGKRTDTAAANGASVDFLTAGAFGARAYLQVFAGFVGTSVTVKVQSSSDNGVGDAFSDVTGLTFTAATGITSQRVATTNTFAMERYLRVVTTGVFTNAVFSVILVRGESLTVL